MSAYDLWKEPSWTNAAALGLDVVGAALPFATGLGKAFKAIDKAKNAKKIERSIVNEGKKRGKDALKGNENQNQPYERPKSPLGGLTNKEIAQKAAELVYTRRIPPQKTPFDSRGQTAYTDGRQSISPDVGSHKGGAWKLFDDDGRIGTFNFDLTIKIEN